jgi:hypothetical protein
MDRTSLTAFKWFDEIVTFPPGEESFDQDPFQVKDDFEEEEEEEGVIEDMEEGTDQEDDEDDQVILI